MFFQKWLVLEVDSYPKDWGCPAGVHTVSMAIGGVLTATNYKCISLTMRPL
jgi:hypothetical protein